MLDKDKLILLFNININEIAPEDVGEFARETAKQFESYFDESVKCIFAVTRNDRTPTVQAVTDFPVEGISLIENLIELKDIGDDEAYNIQLEAARTFIKEYQNGKSE